MTTEHKQREKKEKPINFLVKYEACKKNTVWIDTDKQSSEWMNPFKNIS